MKTATFLFAALLAGASAASAATTATATLAVDFTESGGVRFPAPASIAYAPSWADATATADSCELLMVTHVGQEQCATQTLVSATSLAGAYSLNIPADGSRAVRLILRALSGGSVVGTLAKDISLAVVSPASAGGYFDTTDEKLDRVVATGEHPQLVYSSAWADGVESLAIDVVPQEGAQTTLFTANAPADGTYEFSPVGEKRTTNAVRLHFYDSGAAEIGAPLVAYYTGIADPATVIYLR
jgi:hypothetical protein